MPSGGPLTAAAEQFQPAAEAEADMTTKLAAAAATTQSILRTKDLLWDRTTALNDAGRRIKRFPGLDVERRTAARCENERRGCAGYRLKRPSSCTTSPSALSRPPARRSQMRSQCSAERFLPPVSG